MDKLCCDICGGILTMQPGGKTVICDSCGMQYGVERLREKVQEIKGTVSVEGTVRTQDADFIIRGGVLERYNGNDTDVVIPDSVVKIGKRAFESCPGIRSVTISDSVNEIGDCAFLSCVGLKSAIFFKVVKISDGAFSGCQSLEQVILPETVKTIGQRAFCGCTNLELINIPDSAECGESAFENCPSLREVIISEDKKEKLFIGDGYNDMRSLRPAQDIFEEYYENDDGDRTYYSENCGPWYLNFKQQFEEKELKRVREERKAANVCQYCGEAFTGMLFKKCRRCDKPKDY